MTEHCVSNKRLNNKALLVAELKCFFLFPNSFILLLVVYLKAFWKSMIIKVRIFQDMSLTKIVEISARINLQEVCLYLKVCVNLFV